MFISNVQNFFSMRVTNTRHIWCFVFFCFLWEGCWNWLNKVISWWSADPCVRALSWLTYGCKTRCCTVTLQNYVAALPDFSSRAALCGVTLGLQNKGQHRLPTLYSGLAVGNVHVQLLCSYLFPAPTSLCGPGHCGHLTAHCTTCIDVEREMINTDTRDRFRDSCFMVETINLFHFTTRT